MNNALSQKENNDTQSTGKEKENISTFCTKRYCAILLLCNPKRRSLQK